MSQTTVPRRRRAAAAVGLAIVTASGCGGDEGPSTLAEVCDRYSSLSEAVLNGNGVFDNPIFTKAGRLGSVAERYESDSAVQSDGRLLSGIADSDSTSIGDLEDASRNVAAACGEPPLSMNALLGD